MLHLQSPISDEKQHVSVKCGKVARGGANLFAVFALLSGVVNKIYEWQMSENLLSLIGRCLIAVLFLSGAVQKAVDPAAAQALLAGWNWPQALVWLALAYNALAGLALILGVAVRPVALSLAAYCALTAFFHLIPDDPWQMSIFVKNWAIAGGCLVLAAQGGGALRLRFADKPLGSR